MRATIYARVSTSAGQQSPEMQLHELREFCQRGLGIFRCILGAFCVIGVLSGHSMSSVHGFGGLVMLSQGSWYVAAGVLLLNSKTAV